MPVAQAESDFGGGFEELDAGTYHFVILESLINPPKHSGGVFYGFHCILQVRGGTRPDMIGRKLKGRFAFPNATQTEKGQRFLRCKIFNLLVAVGIAQEEDRGTDKSFTYCVGGEVEGKDDLRGKQIVACVVTEPSKSTGTDGVEREYLNPDIDGVKIYHVHNPEVAAIPKDVAAAKLIPVPAAYQPKAGSGSGGDEPPAGSGNGAKLPPKKPQGDLVGAGAASGDIDLSDL